MRRTTPHELLPVIAGLLVSLSLLLGGCQPTFNALACYGPGECAPGQVCIGGKCTPSADMEITRIQDAQVDPQEHIEYKPTPGFGDHGITQIDNPTLKLNALSKGADGVLFLGGARGAVAQVGKLQADGRPDPSFATEGWRTLALLSSTYQVPEILALPSGAVPVLGYPRSIGHEAVDVWRLTADGAPDSTFGNAGRVELTGLREYGDAVPRHIMLAGERPLVVAQVHVPNNANGDPTWSTGVARLRANGSLDTTYATDGLFFYRRADGIFPVADHAMLDPNSSQLLLAVTCKDPQAVELCAMRLTDTGEFENQFGTRGLTRFPLMRDTRLNARGRVWPSEDGLLLINSQDSTLHLVRLDHRGEPEEQFGSNGHREFEVGPTAKVLAVAEQCDRLLVVRSTDEGAKVAAVNEDENLVQAIEDWPTTAAATHALIHEEGLILVGTNTEGPVILSLDAQCP